MMVELRRAEIPMVLPPGCWRSPLASAGHPQHPGPVPMPMGELFDAGGPSGGRGGRGQPSTSSTGSSISACTGRCPADTSWCGSRTSTRDRGRGVDWDELVRRARRYRAGLVAAMQLERARVVLGAGCPHPCPRPWPAASPGGGGGGPGSGGSASVSGAPHTAPTAGWYRPRRMAAWPVPSSCPGWWPPTWRSIAYEKGAIARSRARRCRADPLPVGRSSRGPGGVPVAGGGGHLGVTRPGGNARAQRSLCAAHCPTGTARSGVSCCRVTQGSASPPPAPSSGRWWRLQISAGAASSRRRLRMAASLSSGNWDNMTRALMAPVHASSCCDILA